MVYKSQRKTISKKRVEDVTSTTLKNVSKVFTPSRTQALKQRRFKERKKYRIKFFVILSIVLTIIGCIGYVFLARTKMFSIKDIVIDGNQYITSEQIKDVMYTELQKPRLFGIIPSTSLLALNKNGLEKRILHSFSDIKDVSIEIHNQHIEVSIHEREPYALWCSIHNDHIQAPCVVVDKNLFGFRDSPFITHSSLVPLVRKGVMPGIKKYALQHEERDFIKKMISYFEEKNIIISNIIIHNDDSYDINVDKKSQKPFSQGRILLSSDETASSTVHIIDTLIQGKSLEDILLQEHADSFEYIDLRFGDKVFYKVNGGKGAEPLLQNNTEQE